MASGNRKKTGLKRYSLSGIVFAAMCLVSAWTADVAAATPRPNFKPINFDELMGGASPQNPFVSNRMLSGVILSEDDIGHWKDALSAARKGNFRTARRYARKAQDRELDILIDWYELRREGKNADLDELRNFLDRAPALPGITNLYAIYEQQLDGRVNIRKRISWFSANPPQTPLGKVQYGRALVAIAQMDEGVSLIREGWRTGNFGKGTEDDILRDFGRYLTAKDHTERLDFLLWRGFITSAKRQMAHVGPRAKSLAEARIALRQSRRDVDAKIKKLDFLQLQDPGLVYERTRWRRRKGRYDEAADLLLAATFDTTEQREPAIIWRERKRLARELISEHRFKDAYLLVNASGLESGVAFADAEWLAGWIALEHMHHPRRAARHFFKLYNGVSRPISRARAAYWMGRSAQQLGKTEAAEKWFASAARYGETIYGTLGREALGYPRPPLMDGAITISAADLEPGFETHDLVPIIRRLHALEESNLVRNLFHIMLDEADDRDEPSGLLQLTAFAHDLGRIDLGLDAAKRASYRGVNLIVEAYPVVELPGVDLLPQLSGLQLEPALGYAIQRQESGFRADATSHVGASGLMQLMPATAQKVAKQLNLSYSRDALVKNPNYNALLGSAYLAQMVQEFDGSYILAVAAYNAGPHRVYRWIREYGDPRAPNIDPINWMETIPFSETRNYVQRVIEAVPIYRARLGEMQADAQNVTPILQLAQDHHYGVPRPSLASSGR